MLTRHLVNLSKNSLRRLFSSEEKYAVTPLFEFHKEHGGKMVNFGGFMLPVQYNDLSIANSHIHTRKSASLFDVSHMLQTEITGKDSIPYLESLCTADIQALPENGSVLTVFTNDEGGILDDLIVTKISNEHLFIVSNAGRRVQDQEHMINFSQNYRKTHPRCNLRINFFESDQRALIALQGPKAADCLQKLTDVDLTKLFFMRSIPAKVAEIGACRITRCGYTGEDGFEISIPSVLAYDLSKQLMGNTEVKLAGLGARDSLRLEAGLCLYGNDISTETTPVEAGLTWLIAKRRRQAADFPGSTVILKQIKEGAQRKRVGLVLGEGPPARQNSQIFDEQEDQHLGIVTSGCPAPFLEKNIAMGYVPSTHAKPGTNLTIKIRDRTVKAMVTKMPFVECHYYVNNK